MSNEPQMLADAFNAAIGKIARDLVGKTPSLKEAEVTINTSLSFAVEKFRTRFSGLGATSEETERTIDKARASVRLIYEVCDSPIERLLLPWIIFADYGKHFDKPPVGHIYKHPIRLPHERLILIPQFTFGPYRLDFALVAQFQNAFKLLAIECDGAGYHDAAKDRERDAYFAQWGIPTVRATGSEIHKMPLMVAARVSDIVWDWAEKHVRIS
jgi:very-short-patch-repair endonuclease